MVSSTTSKPAIRYRRTLTSHRIIVDAAEVAEMRAKTDRLEHQVAAKLNDADIEHRELVSRIAELRVLVWLQLAPVTMIAAKAFGFPVHTWFWSMYTAIGWQGVAGIAFAALIAIGMGFGVIEFEPLDEATSA